MNGAMRATLEFREGGARDIQCPAVTCYRAVLLAIVVYVSLDVALPMMPGAFVFDPGDSVESTELRRNSAFALIPLPSLVHDPSPPVASPIDVADRIAPTRAVVRREQPVARWLPRSVLSAPSPAEDSD
jgi:hypothetical protein